MHQFTVSAGHVHYNKLHSFTVVVFEQIVTDHIMFSVWKNVYDPPVLRISENTLEFLALCISSELIDSQNLRSLPVLKSISLMILAAVGGDILFCTAILLMLRHSLSCSKICMLTLLVNCRYRGRKSIRSSNRLPHSGHT